MPGPVALVGSGEFLPAMNHVDTGLLAATGRALEDSGQDEELEGWRDPAQNRGRAEAEQADDEDPPPAVDVGESPGNDQERRENRERVDDLHQYPGASAAVPPDIFRPSLSVTIRALARCEPSLARYPSTVTASPGLSKFIAHPRRSNPLTAPIVNSQFVTVPA